MTDERSRSWPPRIVHPRAAVAGPLVGLVAFLVFAYWPGRGDDADRLEDVIGDGEITTESVTLDDYAEVVRIVGEGDIPDADQRRVATALGLYLDDVGRAVLRQVESDASEADESEDFSRPAMVAFFEELGHDEDAALQVAEQVGAWLLELAEPFVPDTDLQPADVGARFEPAGLLIGAVEDGFDAAGDPPVDGNELERRVIEQFREDLALAVAAERGLPPPAPGEYSATLATAFPDYDLVDRLDLAATDARRDNPDAPW